METLFKLNNLTKEINGKILFENINKNISSIDKIGLIGKNGVGKTSFINKIYNNKEYWVGLNKSIFLLPQIINSK